ncbi:response regulator [Cronbergia sp. UHCC 0137]|uniref:response regulator n=1 Tax=Cronbergia sp. UHCC 0137 TaxID=3110239 RepID=UPI002B20A6B2|nr:response regulator [Cronbergia sp. UHCC 0137]MEA5621321.1 response regulator [Cronbergia sp. UHCC 0137]
MKILLVEDDLSHRELLSTTLSAYRYAVDTAIDGQTGLEMAEQFNYDLILLDILIPKLDGISVCRKLRSQGLQTPILMLTAKNSDDDIITGLDAGADDYLIKPYTTSHLLARVRALSRRSKGNEPVRRFEWGALSLDMNLMQVTYKQEVIPLSPKEYSLLQLFLRHPERIYSREMIINNLWSINDAPTESAVTNLIKDLRQRLKASGIEEELIETIYGLGYRLKDISTLNMIGIEPEIEDDLETKQSSLVDGLEIIEEMAEEFQASLPQRIGVLTNAVRSLKQNTLNEQELSYSCAEAHRLIGSLGMFGYMKGSNLSRNIETLLMQDGHLGEQEISKLAKLVTQLQQETVQPPTYPIVLPKQTSLPWVLIVGENSPLTQALEDQALIWGLRVSVTPDWSTVSQQLEIEVPSTIVCSFQQCEQELIRLHSLKQKFPKIAILILLPEDTLKNRLAAIHWGSDRYIFTSKSPEDIFQAIIQVTPQVNCNAKVMIVNDSPQMLETLGNYLRPAGLDITCLHNTDHFLATLNNTKPDVLLLDLQMSNLSGFDLCQIVRQDSQYHHLPILFITDQIDNELIQQSLAVGGDDCICQPVDKLDLTTRIINRLERSRTQQQLIQVYRRQLEVIQNEDEIDQLFPLVNRHYFALHLQQEQPPLSLIYFEIDHFQEYSDRHSLFERNQYLQTIAIALQDGLDPLYLISRLSQKRFGIILSNTTLDNSLTVVQKIRQIIRILEIPGHDSPITVSIGITGTDTMMVASSEHLMLTAEQALEAAKSRGGNTFCLYPS